MTAPVRPASRIMLDSLTAVRGPAALLVFGYHVIHGTQWANWLPGARLGYVGVSLFFILSGFVLAWSYNKNAGAKNFYLRRFARVYPLHLFFYCVALLGLLLFGVSNSAGDLNPLSALLNLVLLQAWVPSWEVIFSNNAVSWSLSCEAFFYLMTPFVLNRLDGMRYRVKAALLGGWFLLMATVSYILAAQSNFMDVVVYANPLLRSGEFALGLALGLFALKVRDGYRVPVIHGYHCLAMIAIALGAMYVSSKFYLLQTAHGLLLAPVWAVLILVLGLWDIQRSAQPREKNVFWKIGVVAGEASFAFYRVHELVLAYVRSVPSAASAHGGITGLVYVVVSLIIASILALLAHYYIERPAHRFIVKKYSQKV